MSDHQDYDDAILSWTEYNGPVMWAYLMVPKEPLDPDAMYKDEINGELADIVIRACKDQP